MTVPHPIVMLEAEAFWWVLGSSASQMVNGLEVQFWQIKLLQIF